MNRRDLIAAGTVVAGIVAGSRAAAGEHDHHAHAAAATSPAAMAAKDLAEAALDCVRKGNACLDHCFDLFKTGDTTLAACAEKVNDMLAVCNAAVAMAGNNSPHLKALAKACLDACDDCRVECEKHAAKHSVCKAGAESCKRTIAACKAVIG